MIHENSRVLYKVGTEKQKSFYLNLNKITVVVGLFLLKEHKYCTSFCWLGNAVFLDFIY